MNSLEDLVARFVPETVELRHTLHAHPELSLKEFQTAKTVAECLYQLPNLTVQTGVGGTTGIKAVLNADKPGPAVLLRADMDALPIQEESEIPYKSTVPGVMHACGHDGHTACLVGTARVLTHMADQVPGPVVFIFQPAEESLGGGGLLVEAGILEQPKVGAAFALHGFPSTTAGKIGLCRGWAMAATGGFSIVVRAKGCHGASPQDSADPIVVAARIIDALQQISSRMISPLKPVVVTVGTIHGGTALNIIPNRVEMTGTVRAADDAVRQEILLYVERIARNIAGAFGAEVDIGTREAYPALHNDLAMCDFVADVAERTLGPDSVEPLGPTMGGEDFAYYLLQVPGVLFRLGMDSPDRPRRSLHHARYNFNDAAMPTGMKMMANLATCWLRTHCASSAR